MELAHTYIDVTEGQKENIGHISIFLYDLHRFITICFQKERLVKMKIKYKIVMTSKDKILIKLKDEIVMKMKVKKINQPF